MIYPGSPEQREEYQAIKYAPDCSQLLQLLKRGTKYTERRGRAMLHGHTAGQLLILIKQMEDGEYEGSVTQAIRAYGRYATTMHAEGIYRYFPRGHAKLWEIWNNYKSVAHLWAAVQLLRGKDPLRLLRGKVIPQWGGLTSPQGFQLFLAYAEFWRHFGITHIAVPTHRHDPAPVVSDVETWTVPAGFALPPVDFPVPALPDPVKAGLDEEEEQKRQKVKKRS
jgi:hypothetical protein